ncbi:MAG: hypothetical protein AAFY78_02355 [Cyanobacteria bacterium J06648_16]
MVRVCQKPLKQNPFEAYRDPETGRWFVEIKQVYFTNVLKPAQSGPSTAPLPSAKRRSSEGKLQNA